MNRSIDLVNRTFRYMKPMYGRYFTGGMLTSFELVILFAIPEINRMLVQMIMLNNGVNTIRNIALIMMGLLMLTPLIALGRYWQIQCSQKLSDNLVKALFNHIIHMPLYRLNKIKTGDYLARLTGDAYNASDMFRSAPIVYFVRFFVVSCVTLTILFYIDWRIALLTLLYNMVCFYVAMLANPMVAKLDNDSRREISLSSNVLIETMRALPVVRIFLMANSLGERYKAHCHTVYLKRRSFRKINGIAFGTVDFFSFSAQLIAFLLAIFLLIREEMTFDMVVYTATIATLSANAMLQLSAFTLSVQPCLVAAKRIFDVLDEPIEEDGTVYIHTKPDKQSAEALRLTNVSFSYPDGTIVLDGINLIIKTGEKVALVGDSGSGKTTLMQIIASLLIPISGNLTFYGTSNATLENIRAFIAYVPQEPVLFDGTVYENIALGNTNAADEDILKAANNAGLDIELNTLVGERGSQLSGGQRQRVAIARAFLKNAPLLLLDEATAALDSETEALLQKSLECLSHGRTTITVAHRLSTIKNADRILVLKHGVIVEEGTHDSLVALGGCYAKYLQSFSA